MSTEMSLAKRLAHTLKSERDAAFSIVSEWVSGAAAARGGRSEMMKMWKALFYCVWMSDGPLVQGELALRLAGLLRRARGQVALDFLGAFFETLRREWTGLDRHRVDKFLALTRRFVYEAFCLVSKSGWANKEMVAGVVAELEKALLEPPNGLSSHVVDVFIDELASSGAADTTPHALTMLAPLLTLLSRGVERTVVARAVKTAFEEALLPTFEAVYASPAVNDDEEMSAEAPPAFRMRGLPPEARIEKHAIELKALIDDRAARQAVRATGFRGVSVAAVARAIFAVAGDAATLGQNRDFAYKVHKQFAELALRVGDAKKEEETYSAAALTSVLPTSTTATTTTASARKRKTESIDVVAISEEVPKVRRVDKGKIVSAGVGVVVTALTSSSSSGGDSKLKQSKGSTKKPTKSTKTSKH